jgi:hypothetical protein
MQIEIRVVTPALHDITALERVIGAAAIVIYRDFLRGGPSVSGDVEADEVRLPTSVDSDDAGEWFPQPRLLRDIVRDPSKVHVLRRAT